LFVRGAEVVGEQVGIAGGHLTGEQMARSLTRVLGEPVRYQSMPFAAYAELGFPGAADLANMFQFKHDFNDDFCAARPVAQTRALHPGLLDFDGWLDARRDEVIAAVAGTGA